MRVFVFAAALLFGVQFRVASAVEPVASFEKIIARGKEAVDQFTLVHFNKGQSTWRKHRYTVSNMKYDVKKTDSLVSPVVAVVTFDFIDDSSAPFQTKEGADATVDYDPEFKIICYTTLNYAFTSEAWVLKGGVYKPMAAAIEKRPQMAFPIDPDKLTPETERVHWAVIRFLP